MEQNVNRRRFLGAAIGTGAAAAWAPSALAHGRQGKRGRRGSRNGGSGSVPTNRISSQLYSWRRVMERSQADAENMLRTLARLGYTEVETAGHYGWTAKQYRTVLERYGLRASSGHDGPDVNAPGWETSYPATLEYAKELGQKYTGFAWHPGPHTEAQYKFLAEQFNKAGEMAKAAGLQFFYHNHDFEFSNKQANGEPLYDILLNETDADLVKFELDLYWIVYGKEDPNRYLASDPARWPLYHVKDKTWRDRKETQPWENWEDVGPGSIDFPQIFDSGEGRHLDKHFIIEHDWPPFSHPNDELAEVKTAKSGADYLQSVRW
jgi:sugar phosphate isomerase/epimerase